MRGRKEEESKIDAKRGERRSMRKVNEGRK
jgi:hypothetical protein